MVNVSITPRRGGGYLRLSGRHHPLANVWRCGLAAKSGGDAVNRFCVQNHAADFHRRHYRYGDCAIFLATPFG